MIKLLRRHKEVPEWLFKNEKGASLMMGCTCFVLHYKNEYHIVPLTGEHLLLSERNISPTPVKTVHVYSGVFGVIKHLVFSSKE
jgi:hypothetical protein